METLWLQRSSSDVPWGFRLQGGREYGTILQVQRVTPGSVASSGLGPGDTIMKIGNVNATGLSHNEGQEIIRNAGNILQLTIKKLSASCQPDGPLSPNYQYDSQVSAQLYQGSPKVTQQQPSYGHSLSQDTNDKPYRIQIHHSKPTSYPESNSYNSRSYADSSQQQAQSYSSPSYSQSYQQPSYGRQNSQQSRSQQDSYQPQSYTPQYSTQTSRDPNYGVQSVPQYQSQQVQPTQYTPVQYQQQPQQQQQAFSPTSYKPQLNLYGASQNSPSYPSSQPKSPSTYQPAPFSPGGTSYYQEDVKSPSYKSPIMPGGGTLNRSLSNEPQQQSSSFSPSQSSSYYNTMSPTGTYSRNASSDYNQADYSKTFPRSYSRQTSQPAGSYGGDQVPYGSPSQNTFSPSGQSSLFNRSTSQPAQHYDPTPEKPSYGTTSRATFSPTRQPMSPTSSSYGSQPALYNSQPTPYSSQPTSYGVEPTSYGSQPASYASQPTSYGSQPTSYGGQPTSYGSQPTSYGVEPTSYSAQPVSPQKVTAAPTFSPSVPAPPPVSDFNSFNSTYGAVSPDISSLSLNSSAYDQESNVPNEISQPAPPVPPPPPPPPPPSGPPPPPPPPMPPSLVDWRRDDEKKSPGTSSNKQDGNKVPEGLISAMNKPGKKPFSYGIDLEELKQRTSRQAPPVAPKTKKQPVPTPAGAPVTAPKPNVAKTNVMPGGPPGSGSTYKNQSETLRMIQEREASKNDPRSEVDESHIHVNPTGPKGKQSLSFKVLQWMTDTDNPNAQAASAAEQVPERPKPKKQRNPLLRHNSEDDEMRFSGLHGKSDIPSKAFGRVQNMTANNAPVQPQEQNENDGQETVGNYDETSIRYKGKFIPSPSFRVLQNWAALDTDVETPAQRRANVDEEDDGLPDTLSNEEMVDVRYKGGHIPSRVFKSLQKAVGDETPENTPASQNGNAENAQPRIKVISKAVPQTVHQGDNAGTDF